MKRILALATALTLLPALTAGAAVIYLKDGGQIQGTILNRSANYVEVATSGTTVRIGTDKILRIDENAPATQAPAVEPAAPPPSQAWTPYSQRTWKEERNLVSLDFGLAAPLSNVDFSGIGGGSASNGDVGPLVGFQYLYALDPRWSAGFDFNYFYRNGTDSPGLLANAESTVSGNDVVMLALLKYSFIDHGRVRPYLAGGVGPGWMSTMIDAVPSPGFVWNDTLTNERRRLVDGSGWTWATAARAGLDFPMGPEVFGLEVGWTHLGQTSPGVTAAGRSVGLTSLSAPLDAITVAGRWGWRF